MNLFERVEHLLERGFGDAGRRAMFAKLKQAGAGGLLKTAPFRNAVRDSSYKLNGAEHHYQQHFLAGKDAKGHYGGSLRQFKPGIGHKEPADLGKLSGKQRTQLRTSILHKSMHRSPTMGVASVHTDHSLAQQKKNAGPTFDYAMTNRAHQYGKEKANAQKAHLRLKIATGKDAEHVKQKATALRAAATRNTKRHEKARAAIRARKGQGGSA